MADGVMCWIRKENSETAVLFCQNKDTILTVYISLMESRSTLWLCLVLINFYSALLLYDIMCIHRRVHISIFQCQLVRPNEVSLGGRIQLYLWVEVLSQKSGRADWIRPLFRGRAPNPPMSHVRQRRILKRFLYFKIFRDAKFFLSKKLYGSVVILAPCD
jgi:hypothetical protein